MKRRGEFALIADLFSPLSVGEAGAFGLTDDAAVLSLAADRNLVVTTDAIVSGVHFLPFDTPEDIAAKVIRVNLSDLAAMGADPVGILSACLFSEDMDETWVVRFAEGMKSDLDTFGIPLIGGDTVKTAGPASFCVTALGSVPKGQELRRKGASPGDWIVVSGSIGDGALGLLGATGRLSFLSERFRSFLCRRYHRPEPRLRLGIELRGIVSAAMDISDGLIQDTGHICKLSGVGARLERQTIPLSEAAQDCLQNQPLLWDSVLTGGDDYEILPTIPPDQWDLAVKAALISDVTLTRIGICTREERIQVLDENGKVFPVTKEGYTHF